MKKLLTGDCLIAGGILITGLAEAVHLAGVLLGWPFARCAAALGGLVCAAAGAGICVLAVMRKRGKGFSRGLRNSGGGESGQRSRGELLSWAAFAVLAASQLAFICAGDTACREGDMTVETVGSFLAMDGIYQVNPVTGANYTQGIPSRLKILCLPTLYGSLCKITGLSPETVVHRVIPVMTLLGCYTAFGLVSASLFPQGKGEGFREKRACFMTIVSFLLWAGAYQYGMDGFNLLCCGWRGVTIRNLVYLPWILSLCIRRNWLPALLCIPGEACTVWTLYGCGICLPFLAGMALAQWCCGKFSARGSARGGGAQGRGEGHSPVRIKEKCGGRDGGITS